MIDIIAGVLLFGGAVEKFVQDDDMRAAWQEQMDSAWTLTISYSLMAAGAWGLLIFGIITELQ